MPTGFASYLPDGRILQIDENYKNLELVRSYTLTATRLISVGSPNAYDVSITVSGTLTPMIAIRSPNTYVSLLSTVTSGSSVTYRFGALSNSQSFTVYLFDTPSQVQTSFGFQVFNAQGELIFDAGKKYTKVVGSYNFSNWTTANITYPSTDSHAFVPSGFLGYFEDYHDAYETGVPFSVKTKGAVFWRTETSRLTAIQQQFWTSPRGGVGNTSPFNYEITAGTIQILNVTNF